MAGIRYTEKQQAVIDARGSNLLVSAAAGSGKTAVLTARILSLLTDPHHPIDIDRMLIVTFTKAAAAEMRERIGKAIAEYSAAHPEDMRMDRQAALLHNAQITTIDSFCLYVVRNNFADIALDPGFRILDTGERKLMMKDVMDALLEEEYAAEKEDFLHFIESYGGNGKEDAAAAMILRLFDSAMSRPQPKKWLQACMEEALADTLAEAERLPWFERLSQSADRRIQKIGELCGRAIELSRREDGPAAYLPAAGDYQLLAERLGERRTYAERRHLLQAFEVPKLSPKKGKTEDAELREKAKKEIGRIRELLQDLRAQYDVSDAQFSEMQEHIRSTTMALCRLTIAFAERFAALKREKNVLDFTDMEHFALQILLEEDGDAVVPGRAAREYRDYFEYICVDEYQDSNYVQEYLLKSIAREDNYFMVGDVKQSIYRFRLARPEIFLEKYNSFTEEGIDRRIDLNQNFRSRSEVIDFVNLIFRQIMRMDTAGMDYDDRAALYVGADYPAEESRRYQAELLVLDPEAVPQTDEKEAEEDKKLTAKEMECRLAADRIRRLKQEGFQVWDRDEKKLRALRYSDIVILVRSTKDYEKPMRNAFQEYDIPLHCGTQNGYFAAMEVRMVLAALQVIDNPQQDIPLYACLTSFLQIFTEEEIAKLRAAVRKGKLYDVLRQYARAPEADAVLTGKIGRFMEWLKKYRACAKYKKVRELLGQMLTESGYLDYVTALPNGAQRRANLELLLERASDFENASYQGLFHFVRYIGQLKSQEDMGEAGLLEESADVVRMMTIHKSKGLEFPVCICMGLYKKFNMQDARNAMLLDPDLGIGLDAVDPKRRCSFPGLKRSVLAQKAQEDAQAEEMRILYVALTRAKEKLILTEVRHREEGEEEEEADAFAIRKAASAMALIRLALAANGKTAEYERVFHMEDLRSRAVREVAEAVIDEQALLQGELPVDTALREEMRLERERIYPHPELRGLYTKTSVSELKHAAYDEEEAKRVFETEQREAYIPSFAEEKEKSSGTARGSAYHRFLELLPYERMPEDAKERRQWLERCREKMRAEGRLSGEYDALIRLPAMERFLMQEIAGRMSEAAKRGDLFREQPFFMGVPAKELGETFPDHEHVIIQGVIDVYLAEPDGLVLLDYKTDRVTNAEELITRYRTQLDLYARALEQIRGIAVKEILIYSFALDRTIALERIGNSTERQQACCLGES